MKSLTEYLTFHVPARMGFENITPQVERIVRSSGVKEGLVLVNAMHITAGVYVNDWESGLIHDFQEWLEKLAPSGLDYRHHQTGEDNADAHLKRTIMGHQVMLPIRRGEILIAMRRLRPASSQILRSRKACTVTASVSSRIRS